MRDFIAKNEDGRIVGKWRRNGPPELDDDYDVQEVEDVSEHTIDFWFDED